jgi:hypothetical protein
MSGMGRREFITLLGGAASPYRSRGDGTAPKLKLKADKALS